MDESFRTLHPLKFYKDHIYNNVRPDGRSLDQCRPVVVNAGSINTAEGSALTKVGDTIVICGIKAELCKPKPETPNEGFLIPNIELPALCSPKFKSGPPCEQAQIATKFIDEIIRHSGCINLKDLCIVPEKLAWCLFADIICINYDGALMDASVIALITALKSVKLPKVEYDLFTDTQEVDLEEQKPLEISNIPLCFGFNIFEDKYLLYDATDEEESLSSGYFYVITKNNELCMIHKPGGSSTSDDNLMKCIDVWV